MFARIKAVTRQLLVYLRVTASSNSENPQVTRIQRELSGLRTNYRQTEELLQRRLLQIRRWSPRAIPEKHYADWGKLTKRQRRRLNKIAELEKALERLKV